MCSKGIGFMRKMAMGRKVLACRAAAGGNLSQTARAEGA